MAIHHATLALAFRNNVELIENTEERTVAANVGDFVYTGRPDEKAKDVLADAMALRTIRREFGSLKPVRAETDWTIEFEGQAFGTPRLADTLSAVQEYAEENGLDIPEEAEEQDDEAADEPVEGVEEAEAEEQEDGAGSGSVVRPKYRRDYKERGDPANCGDWLARVLKDYTVDKKAGLDLDFYCAILDANDIDHSKYDVKKPSDRGRLRMSTGISLRKKVANAGVLIIPATGDADDVELTPPADFVAKNASKPKEAGKGRKKAAA
jgi:hypothetical protein